MSTENNKQEEQSATRCIPRTFLAMIVIVSSVLFSVIMFSIGIYGIFGMVQDSKSLEPWREDKCIVVERIVSSSRESEGRKLYYYKYNVTYGVFKHDVRNSISSDETTDSFHVHDTPKCFYNIHDTYNVLLNLPETSFPTNTALIAFFIPVGFLPLIGVIVILTISFISLRLKSKKGKTYESMDIEETEIPLDFEDPVIETEEQLFE
eukprot:gene865-9114_t